MFILGVILTSIPFLILFGVAIHLIGVKDLLIVLISVGLIYGLFAVGTWLILESKEYNKPLKSLDSLGKKEDE